MDGVRAPAPFHWIARQHFLRVGHRYTVDSPAAVTQHVTPPRVQVFPREVIGDQVVTRKRRRLLVERQTSPYLFAARLGPQAAARHAETRHRGTVQTRHDVRDRRVRQRRKESRPFIPRRRRRVLALLPDINPSEKRRTGVHCCTESFFCGVSLFFNEDRTCLTLLFFPLPEYCTPVDLVARVQM